MTDTLKNYAYTKHALYSKIETAVLSERQRAVSASCYTGEDGAVRVVVCYPVTETVHKNFVYLVEDNKARAQDDPHCDVITLW